MSLSTAQHLAATLCNRLQKPLKYIYIYIYIYTHADRCLFFTNYVNLIFKSHFKNVHTPLLTPIQRQHHSYFVASKAIYSVLNILTFFFSPHSSHYKFWCGNKTLSATPTLPRLSLLKIGHPWRLYIICTYIYIYCIYIWGRMRASI